MVMPVCVDGRGQAALDAGHAILHVDGGDVEVVAGLEGDGDRAGAAVGARGADVAHSLDAVDGFFERDGDGLLDGLGVGAHVVSDDADLRRSQVGYIATGRVGMQTAPARMISSAQTVAKTGR